MSENKITLLMVGAASTIYYPLSLHLQEVYKPLGYKPTDFPQSELAQTETLSLPIYPELSERQLRKIVEAISNFGEVKVA